MLSIPRDLWVNIPNWSYQKINAANETTSFSQAGYPNGGMGQLEEIVQTDLGIPIDYYVLLDYSSFEEAVNAVGGISINIQSSDPRGLYDSFTGVNLPNGRVTLNGLQALALARARGDNGAGDISYGFPQSDYDRTEHQRQMLIAVAQKAKTAGFIANPIKVTRLFDAFGNNIQTDLNLQDVLRFIHITKGMNVANLKSLTYSDSGTGALLTGYTDPASGEEALIPIAGINNFSQLQQYYQTLTSKGS
jgi:LCP family protein required for cell wall assembly